MEISANEHQIDQKNWNDFITQHPHGNFFQSPQFFHFLHELPGVKPSIISAWYAQQLVGLLLAFRQKENNGVKGFFSRRTIVYGGPLVTGWYGDTVVQLLLKHLHKEQKSIYTEFRNLFDLSKYRAIFEKLGYTYNQHLNYIVSIPDEAEATLQLLNSSKRRQVRKSLKNGAEITKPNGIEEVWGFYEILKQLYRQKIKKPLPNWEFFKNFHKNKNLGVYLLVKYNKKVIGGIMCPVLNNTLYEWYICGEDNQYKNIYPSVLATYAPIAYAAKNGLQYFDFMGAGKPGQDYGVREFKSKFGGEEVENGRFIRVNNKFLFSIGKVGLKALSLIR